jgi:NADP-dependent 3-hydroxy acid dehydrogenase YdfG
MTGPLAGKVALVTGASSGIGAATAEALAAQGVRVVVAARRVDRLEEVAGRIRNSGGEATPVALDVTDESSCRQAVHVAVDTYGGLDILVNCAGLMLLGRVENADTAEWVAMINTNVLGLMFMTHAALPHLLESRGTVVQMSSAAGRTPRPNTSVYNASKFAVGAFGDALRQEVGDRGVRVIVMEPGSTNTDLRHRMSDQTAKAAVEARIAGITQLEPTDVADAIVYALAAPPHVSFNEVLFRPTQQNW